MIREESAGTAEIRREDPAYRSGWEDGRFGSPEIFVSQRQSGCLDGVPGPARLLSRPPRWQARARDARGRWGKASDRVDGSLRSTMWVAVGPLVERRTFSA